MDVATDTIKAQIPDSGPSKSASTDSVRLGLNPNKTNQSNATLAFHKPPNIEVRQGGQPAHSEGSPDASARSIASSDDDSLSRLLSGNIKIPGKASNLMQKASTAGKSIGLGAKDSVVELAKFSKSFTSGAIKSSFANSASSTLVVGLGILFSGALALKNLFKSVKLFSGRFQDDELPAVAFLLQGGLWSGLFACLSSKVFGNRDPFGILQGGKIVTPNRLVIGGLSAPLIFGGLMKFAKGQFPLLSKAPFFGSLSQEVIGAPFKAIKALNPAGQNPTAGAGAAMPAGMPGMPMAA